MKSTAIHRTPNSDAVFGLRNSQLEGLNVLRDESSIQEQRDGMETIPLDAKSFAFRSLAPTNSNGRPSETMRLAELLRSMSPPPPHPSDKEFDPSFLFVYGNGDGHAVDYDDIKQGQIGDCWLMAGMASMADSNPQAIYNLFSNLKHDPKTGAMLSCTVNLWGPDGQRKAIDVDCTKFPEKHANLGDHKEIWPMVIEKAYAQMQAGYYNDLNGGWSGDAMYALTGKKAAYNAMSAATFESIQQNISARNLVTFSTPVSGPELSRYSLVANHAYSVVDTYSAANGDQWVKVYNPWGFQQPANPSGGYNDGSWMRFNDCKRLFQGFTVGPND